MVEIADTSPYLYLATAAFAISSLWSDLLCIRASLTFGFIGLVLASLSGYDPKGSFSNMPIKDGTFEITMVINVCLLCLNAYIFARLVRDETHRCRSGDEEELALFYYFRSRCGLTYLQFKHIYKHGKFVEVKEGELVLNCHRTLYLVVEGKVTCNCRFNGKKTRNFVKRSGEFFDIRMFNVFTLPIGFDNTEFQARTLMPTKLFCWDVCGLVAMRDLKSPMLTPFWEFTVLRVLSGAAVRHHLKERDTLYDSLLVPEDQSWLRGARSRDFFPRGPEKTRWEKIKDQFRIFSRSLHPIPPNGVRHRPGILEPNPKQADLEASCVGRKRRSLLGWRTSRTEQPSDIEMPTTDATWNEED